MGCIPQTAPAPRTFDKKPHDPVEPVLVVVATSTDTIRDLTPPRTKGTDVILQPAGQTVTARYFWDPARMGLDDDVTILLPTHGSVDRPGRWVRQDLGGISTHTGDPNPHPQYQLLAEKGAPNGYPNLDAGTKVPVAQVPNLPASIITSGQLALARGGTNADLSATGGTAKLLKQLSAGAPVTVDTLQASEVPSGIDATKIGGGNVDDTEFGRLDGVTSNIQDQLDALGQGIKWKQSVRAASLANVSIASAPASLDGVTGAADDRWLLKNQTAPAENGLYKFNGTGNPLTRTADADASLELEAAVVLIEEGTQAGDLYRQSEVNFTLGTDPVTWVFFQSLSDLVAGDGLTKVGDTVHVGEGDGIQVNADDIEVKLDGPTLSKSAAGVKVNPSTLAGFLEKTGLTEWDEQTAYPSTPASGKHVLQFMPDGLHQIEDTDEVIGPIRDHPNLWRSLAVWGKAAGKVDRTVYGHSDAMAGVGTPAASHDTDGQFIKYTSAAALNSDAGWKATAFAYFQIENRLIADIVFKTGDRLTDIRIWVGLWDQDPMGADDPGGGTAGRCIAIRFSTSAADGNFKLTTKDGATLNVVDTGITPATDTKYRVRLFHKADLGEIWCFFDGKFACLSNANLPDAGKQLGPVSASRTLSVAPDDVYHKNQIFAVEYDG